MINLLYILHEGATWMSISLDNKADHFVTWGQAYVTNEGYRVWVLVLKVYVLSRMSGDQSTEHKHQIWFICIISISERLHPANTQNVTN